MTNLVLFACLLNVWENVWDANKCFKNQELIIRRDTCMLDEQSKELFLALGRAHSLAAATLIIATCSHAFPPSLASPEREGHTY